jgi:segregation and condensation protein B
MLEALLFASGAPLSKKRLANLLGVSTDMLARALEALTVSLEGRGLAVVETQTEVELRTAPGASELVLKLRENELSRDLGKAGLETLAIVLYRGSATRGEIDWVRGVNSSQTLRSLLLRGLVEKTEDQTDKRRVRYIPTVDALGHLGVRTREELPEYAEFNTSLKDREASVVETQEI